MRNIINIWNIGVDKLVEIRDIKSEETLWKEKKLTEFFVKRICELIRTRDHLFNGNKW